MSLVLDGGFLVHAGPAHHRLDAVAAKALHQLVFQGYVELGTARVTLATGAAPQLVVDTAGVVVFGADDVEAAKLDYFSVFADPLGVVGAGAAQHDIGTAPGHVGGHGYRPQAAGLGHDARFLGVVLGVQYLVRYAAPLEAFAQGLGGFDGSGADQDGTSVFVGRYDVLDHRLPLGLGSLENQVRIVFSHHIQVGGDDCNLQAINLIKLVGLGGGGTGHAGQLLVHSEVVLKGDGGVGYAFPLDFHPLLGFNGLVEAVGPAAPKLEAAGELVNDDYVTVAEDIVLILDLLHLGGKGVFDVVDQVVVIGVVQVVDLGPVLHLFDTLLREGDGLGALVDGVVFGRVQAGHQAGEGPGSAVPVPQRDR